MFDIATDGEPLGHVSFQLFADKVSKIGEKFQALSTEEKGFAYKDSCFHIIVPRFMCQGGDFTHHNGTGSMSIYREKFHENFILNHTGLGFLFMANAGHNTNGSQIFTCTAKTEWLAGKHVVFRQVKDGMDVVTAMECYGSSRNGKTSTKIILTVDSSHKCDLFYLNHQSIPSVPQEGFSSSSSAFSNH